MTSLSSVNPKRAWLLFAAVWLPLVAYYSWSRVEHGWYESNRVREDINRSLRETRFQDCVRAKGVDWFQHIQRYKYECEAQVLEICDGSGWCATLTDECLKGKVAGCESFAFVVAGDGSDSDFGLNDRDFRKKKERERVVFYLERTFSYPLYTAVGWAIVPLLLPLVLPRILRALWSWLTTMQK